MFLSQQVERNVTITKKNDKYKLTDELLNDIRLKKNSMELSSSVQFSSQNVNIVYTSKKLLKNRYWTFALEQYFTWNLKILITRS